MANRFLARLFGPRLLKHWLPKTLWGRSFLIIVLPIGLMQLAVAWYFLNPYWRDVTESLSYGLAGDVAWVVEDYRRAPDPDSFARLSKRTEKVFGLSVALKPGELLPAAERPNVFAERDRTLRRALTDQLDAPFWFDTTRYTGQVEIRVKVGDGVLKFFAPQDRAFASIKRGQVFILWIIITTFTLTAVAVLFIRNQVRAIERLAEAAEAFGRGGDALSFKPHGAREVRQAAQAFLDMKERIQRYIAQRTALLASVSHDLRTPLTRLKLELALAEPSPRIQAMERDLGEMEHMIDEYLDFARGEGGEAMQLTALAPLIESVAEGARRTGAKVSVTAPADLAVQARPNALRRALANLVDNAAAHAKRVEIGAERRPHAVEIHVDDDGPGIPAAAREDAFVAFNRLDDARNQNLKGVGLGLAIARDVARAHGGEVLLADSPLGGLRAVVRLPA
ncbi:MAG: integral rane sensor signal transduction histidine kinase [Caulobacteraceae bacterium]|nr:integral rane sensor signal transduction histidine kinase [Caulobacteraceae bacterium]